MTATLEPSTFTDTEREALFTVCLLAAFADGAKDERERAELQRLVQSLPDGELHAAEALNNVMFKKIDLKEVAPLLTTTEARSRAGEMALCICEADGRITIQEHEFLSRLINALGLPASTFAGLICQADAVSMAPLADSMRNYRVSRGGAFDTIDSLATASLRGRLRFDTPAAQLVNTGFRCVVPIVAKAGRRP